MTKTVTHNITVSLTTTNLQAKVDSLIPKDYKTYKWIRNLLLDSMRTDSANIICEYLIAMRSESNRSLSTIRNIICILSRFIKTFDPHSFHDIGNSDISLYLNSFRKSEDQDPTQKWIGTHTYVLSTLSKFFFSKSGTTK
jgi:hypothetical protein